MGAWGTAIFSNDTSSDVREEFVDLIGDGLDAEEATRQMVSSHGVERPPLGDPDEAVDFWLGLALTQHRLGRLLPDIRAAAEVAIADPRELERWPPDVRRKRGTALAKALAKLGEPLPAPKRIRKRVRSETTLEPGQHVVFSLGSGARIMLRVLSIHEDKGGRGPRVAVLEWAGDALPKDPSSLAVRRDPLRGVAQPTGFGFILFGNPGDPWERLEIVPPKRPGILARMGRSTPPAAGPEPPGAGPAGVAMWVSRWDDLDRWFAADGSSQYPTE